MIAGSGLFFTILGVVGAVLLLIPNHETKRVLSMPKLNEPESFNKDFDKYRDVYGLVQNNPDGNSSGNGVRYTSEYFILGFRYGVFKYAESGFTPLIDRCMVLPGLLGRLPAPNNRGQGALDDYVLATTASIFNDQTVARSVLSYGQKNHWFYNNESPERYTLKSWFGRYPGLIAHFYNCVGERPPLFNNVAWCFSLLWCALTAKENQDEWVLSYYLIIAYEMSGHYSWIQDKIIKYWKARFYKYWPGGMRALLTRYFGHEHPLAKWAIDP